MQNESTPAAGMRASAQGDGRKPAPELRPGKEEFTGSICSSVSSGAGCFEGARAADWLAGFYEIVSVCEADICTPPKQGVQLLLE
jgi:hypothetical protein